MPNKPKQRNESPDPKARGSARSGKREVSAASLANLKKWQPGQSGNPSGKSSSLNDIMRLARSHAPAAIAKLCDIMNNPKAPYRDQITAAIGLLDRGCGKSVTPVLRGVASFEAIESGSADGEVTALLRVAGRDTDGNYRRALQAELQRLDDEEAQEKAARRDEVDEAREAMARGEPVSPLMKMLVQVKNETE